MMKTPPTFLPFAAVVVASLMAAGCEKAVDLETEKTVLRQTNDDHRRAVIAKDLDALMSFFADDIIFVPPEEPAIRGEARVSDWMATTLETLGLEVNWETTDVSVAASGDMGYTLARLQVSFPDARGNMTTFRGQDLHVWKKETDGSWKIVLDIWNFDQPLVFPPPPRSRR